MHCQICATQNHVEKEHCQEDPLSSSAVYVSSPYRSGYDHGCDDARISDPSDQYINQPEKGPAYHTPEFMDGYCVGVNACGGGTDDSSNEQTNDVDESNTPESRSN